MRQLLARVLCAIGLAFFGWGMSLARRRRRRLVFLSVAAPAPEDRYRRLLLTGKWN